MSHADFENHPHWRLNLLTGERVLVSPHRLKRPWQGRTEAIAPADRPAYDPQCYLCPRNERAGGARNPDYTGTFVFTNDFSALLDDGETNILDEEGLLVAGMERGTCRVICFSPRHDITMADMTNEAIAGVVRTWVEETRILSARPDINCVQVFENKGTIMGCSNPHPHGQIWATYGVPTEISREDERQRDYFAIHKRTLLADYLAIELRKKERIVCRNDHWVCLVPWWAKWPYETMLIPRHPDPNLLTLSEDGRLALADIIRRISCRYDNLFGVPFPYTMGFHQSPFHENTPQEHWHLHAHYYPPLLRSATIQKFMVGFEMLAMPQRDLTPEFAAGTLRELPETPLPRSSS
jgi:UDPglucose--hexose-1-phosphate uridylyltransferase